MINENLLINYPFRLSIEHNFQDLVQIKRGPLSAIYRVERKSQLAARPRSIEIREKNRVYRHPEKCKPCSIDLRLHFNRRVEHVLMATRTFKFHSQVFSFRCIL